MNAGSKRMSYTSYFTFDTSISRKQWKSSPTDVNVEEQQNVSKVVPKLEYIFPTSTNIEQRQNLVETSLVVVFQQQSPGTRLEITIISTNDQAMCLLGGIDPLPVIDEKISH